MKKIIINQIPKLRNIFLDNNKLAIFSLSFFTLSIFLFVLAILTESNELQTQRIFISEFIFAAGFYMIPISTMQRKDKILSEIIKTSFYIIFAIVDCAYWIYSISYPIANLFFDILSSVIFIFITYQLLYRLFLITKILINFINKLTTKIFPNSKAKPNGFKYILERLTAVLISISGALVTVLTIATTVKALIEIFVK